MSVALLAALLSQPLHASALAPELWSSPPPPVGADEGLPSGGLDPVERQELVAETQAELDLFSRRAALVIRGEVLTSRQEWLDGVRIEVLTVIVDEALRGDGRKGDIVELRAPLRGAMSGDVTDTYRSVRGYELLLFADPSGYMVDEDAIYVMEGGFGFRARRPGLLMRPRMDHDWVHDIDPVSDYSVVTVQQVQTTLERVPMGAREQREKRGKRGRSRRS